MTAKETVTSWLNYAQLNSRTEVNFYYSDYNKAFHELAQRATYKGLPIGWEFEGHLYTIEAGSGDCQEFLVHLGKLDAS